MGWALTPRGEQALQALRRGSGSRCAAEGCRQDAIVDGRCLDHLQPEVA